MSSRRARRLERKVATHDVLKRDENGFLVFSEEKILGWRCWSNRDNTEKLETFLTEAAPCGVANAYANAGRPDSNHTFQDLRSTQKAQARIRKRSEKYYGFRAVKPGQLGKQHYCLPGPFPWPPIEQPLLRDAEVRTMTPRQFYNEAQMYPRPPRYHSSRKDTWAGGEVAHWRGKERKHDYHRLMKTREESDGDCWQDEIDEFDDYQDLDVVVESTVEIEFASDSDDFQLPDLQEEEKIREDSDSDEDYVLVNDVETILDNDVDDWELI